MNVWKSPGVRNRLVKRTSIKRWVRRHRGRHQCKCGCGETIEVKEAHYKRGIPKFIKGHNFIGTHNPKIEGEEEIKEHSPVWDLLTEEEKQRRISNLKKFKPGEEHPGWKGGRVYDEYGYVKVISPDHYYSVGGYVLEHRLVMEEYLRENYPGSPYLHWKGGKLYLKPEVVVHHDDEVKDNNVIENLFPFPDSAAHIFWHKSSLPKAEKVKMIKLGLYRTKFKEDPEKDD